MKRIFVILGLTLLILAGCGNNEPSYQDEAFIKDLASNLDERWSYQEKVADDESVSEIDSLKEAISIEIENMNKYKDAKFENSKLQELSIAYINELDTAKQVLENSSSDNFFTEWDNHYNRRSSIIASINEVQEIPVKNKDSLTTLLSNGKEVEAKDELKNSLESLFANVKFEIDEDKSDEYTTYYVALVENTTSSDISSLSALVDLFDADEVKISTEHINILNWKQGETTRLEFMRPADEQINKYTVTIEYFE